MIENDDNLDNLDENKESSFQENSEDISLDSFSDLTAENDLMKNEDENQEDNNQELEIKDENKNHLRNIRIVNLRSETQ